MGGGLIIEANIPVQELEGQRGEGAYFREDTVATIATQKPLSFPQFAFNLLVAVAPSSIKSLDQRAIEYYRLYSES